jgi:hypothetical protein
MFMKRKDLLYLMLFSLACMVAVTSCKGKSEETPSTPPAPETPLFYDGQIVDSKFYIDNVIKEEMIDTVINLGSKEIPALFYLNKSHIIDGIPVTTGNTFSNAFRSLKRGDHFKFIVKWGKLFGLTINLNDTSASAVTLRHHAFFMLLSYLRETDVDLPLLVAITSGSPDQLEYAKRWVDAAHDISKSGYKLNATNTPNYIFRSLEKSGHTPKELSFAAESEGMSEKDFLNMANAKGLSIAGLLKQGESPQQVGIIVSLVCLGINIFSTLTVKMIDAGKPNPQLDDYYVSYLNYADSNSMHYIPRKDTISRTYKCSYSSLAGAEFYVETYYDSYHNTYPGQYVSRSGMIVKSVTCSWGMHVKGSTTYDPASYRGSQLSPIPYGEADVDINYGDCCCFKRHAHLDFNISGDKGYVEESWKASTK